MLKEFTCLGGIKARLPVLLALLWLAPTVVFGQASTGQVRGTIFDQTGAVIAGAAVTITNQETGESRETTSNEYGDYIFKLLTPGTYRVQVKAEGFKQAQIEDIVVRITETTTADVKLDVGAESGEIVTVKAETPLIKLDSASAGQVIEERSIKQLPLPTCNFQQLLTLTAGTASNITNTSEVGRGDTAINVNGQRTTSNSVLINGVDANSIGTGSTPNLAVPATDSLQEFIVQTNPYDASQGRNVGGIITAITKNGGNEFHGNIYYFLRNKKLNANDFFLNAQGIPRQKNDRHQYGGTFGGRLVRDRAFFFTSYQGTRETNGTSRINSLAVVNTAPDLTDDRSPQALAALSLARAPIFRGFVSPVALALLQARYPDGSFLIPSGNGRTVRTLTAESEFREDQFNINTEFVLTPTNRLQIKLFFAENSTTQGLFSQFGLGNAFQTPGYPVDLTADNRLITVTDTQVYSNGMVNEFRFGFNAIPTTANPTEPFTARQFGINNPTGATGMPAISLLNMFTVGPSGFSRSDNQADTTTFADTFSFTKGAHSVKVGGEYRYNRVRADFDVFNRGAITFTGAVALAASRVLPPGSIRLDPFMPLTELLVAPTLSSDGRTLIGLPSIFSIIGPGSAQRAIRAHDYNFFFQDDWKISSRLTLNLGIRYDYYGPFFDTKGRFVTFDDGVPGAGRPGTFTGFFQAENAETPIPGIPTLRKSLVDPDRNNFAPRIGLALRPFDTNRFVLRAGYGVFYDRGNARAAANQSLSFPYYTLAAALPGVPAIARTFANPFAPIPGPGSFPLNPTNRAFFPRGGLPFLPNNYYVPVQGIYPGIRAARTPYVQHYSFGFQWEFISNTMLDISYVGNQGRKLTRMRNANQQAGPNLTGTSPAPSTLSEVPTIGFGVHIQESTAISSYNSLQVTLTRRLSRGLQGLIAYTYSHAIDEYSGQATSAGTSDVSADFGDQASFRGNRASADFDRRHRIVASFVYDLPKIYNGDSTFAKLLLNDYQISAVVIGQTGTPFSVVSGTGLFDASRASFSPSCRGCDLVTDGDVKDKLNNYINKSAFIPSVGRGNFGTTGRNILRGPAQANTDLSVVKFFPVDEVRRFEFRAEFFNLFNQVNFANPINAVANANFGRIVATATGPRLIQFAFKFNF